MLDYSNGKAALVITEASNHQNRYFVFDNDKKGTCLLSIDEYALGFIISSKSSETAGIRIALSKVGGLVSNQKGDIEYEWKWDRNALNPGIPPSTDIKLKLNDFFDFRLRDRYDMSLEYNDGIIKKMFDVSLKHSRNTTYLNNLVKGKNGKYLPNMNHIPLKQRQEEFNEKMRAQRNKVMW
jgi:hypothetical protein